MPWKLWSPGEELLASTFASHVQDQVVATFDSAAQRASAWPSPPKGAVSYVKDVDTLSTYTGSAWLVLGGPRGYVAHGFRTDDIGIGANSNVDYASVTTPALTAGRRIKVTADFQFGNAVAQAVAVIVGYITDASNAIHAQRLSYSMVSTTVSVSSAITVTALLTPPPGPLTVKGRAGSLTPGSVGIYIQECLLIVEDVGAV